MTTFPQLFMHECQFFNIFHTVTFFSNTASMIRLLPVKSSLPATSTIAIPAGNTQALNSLATEGFSIVAEAVVDAIPAKPMNIPAKNPNKIVLKIDRFTLWIPTSI